MSLTRIDENAANPSALNAFTNTFKNKIINGNFDWWQRGTSLANTASLSAYLADRFRSDSTGSSLAVSQQPFVVGQTDVPYFPKFFHRTAVTSVAGAANYGRVFQHIENVNTLAGRTATLSFYAKADAARNIAVDLGQNFGTGGSAFTAGIGAQLIALSTGWKKYSVTVSIPAIAANTIIGSVGDYVELSIWYDAGTGFTSRSANLGQQSGTFDIAQIQLEDGDYTTSFEQRPVGLELLLCQRYYEKSYAPVSPPGTTGAGGYEIAVSVSNIYRCNVKYRVVKRTTPSITPYNINTGAVGTANGDDTTTMAVSISAAAGAVTGFYVTNANTGGSSNMPYYFHWTADAEL